MLKGSELLAFLKENPGLSKTALVRGAGYVSTKKDGAERLNFTAFYQAVLDARGINLGEGADSPAPGRRLSFATKVQFNGNLLIGKAYTARMGLKPGDLFSISLGRRQITLAPLDGADLAEDADGTEAAETAAAAA
jgi:hypothetical protein